MGFMNYYDIDEAARTYRAHPLLGPATRTLQRLEDTTNQCSDGWAYWPKPARSALKLITLIQEYDRNRWRDEDRVEPTLAQLKAAYAPIKALVTRHSKIDPRFVVSFEEPRT